MCLVSERKKGRYQEALLSYSRAGLKPMQLSLEAAVSRPVPGLINTFCDELEYPLLPYQLKQNSKVYLNI